MRIRMDMHVHVSTIIGMHTCTGMSVHMFQGMCMCTQVYNICIDMNIGVYMCIDTYVKVYIDIGVDILVMAS